MKSNCYTPEKLVLKERPAAWEEVELRSQLLAIGTPYKENSVAAIAVRAAARCQLNAFYTTIYCAGVVEKLSSVPPSRYRDALLRETQRRAYPGISKDRVRTVATSWDLALFGLRRMKFTRASAQFTFAVKRHFDEAMAPLVIQSPAQAVLGMWGSCETTFRLAHRGGRFTVMNYVNGHPAEQNRLLRELSGAPAGHSEFTPDYMIARVENETAEADLILVPSRFVQRQLVDRGVPAGRVAVEPYGVDLRAFKPPSRPRNFEMGRRLQVLCVALISYRKGVRDVISAAREMSRDADFHLIGPILEPKLLESLPDNVTYHGTRVQSEIVGAMQASDVLVLPSIEDSYALVVLEAMATALPVIVSDHVGGAESIVAGETGFIFPVTDVPRFVSYLQSLHGDPELRRRMGAAGRSYVEKAAPWDDYADRVLDRIEVACGRRAEPHTWITGSAANQDALQSYRLRSGTAA